MARKIMSKHERGIRALRSAASVALDSGDGSSIHQADLQRGIAWVDSLLDGGNAHGVLGISDEERELTAMGLRISISAEKECALLVARRSYNVGGGLFVGDYAKLVQLHEAVKQQNNGVGIPAVAECERRIARWQDIIRRLEAPTKGKAT